MAKKQIVYVINGSIVSESRGKRILKGKQYSVKEIKENDSMIEFYIKLE